MSRAKSRGTDLFRAAAWAVALGFFVGCTWASYARWANFEYRSFDLAYYVQAIWQLVHGRLELSLAGVPLLGNHVEPIVFLIAPLFALFRHPMTFVIVQNVALAAMGPAAYGVARRIGLRPASALLLALALLLTPATAYVALHEFHPEALTALCLLLMIHARLRNSLRAHWLWLAALLACKENMALLLAAYCLVYLVLERKRSAAELRAWYLWPLVLSILWFLLCTKVITPALNFGTIDYLALYDRLGTSLGDILLNSITEPQRILAALRQSLRHGNLFWAILLPFLALPLLRPQWLLIAAPILLQHLLSWRTSEWTIYFHYAAPLLPLFWIALAEGIARVERARRFAGIRNLLPLLVVIACGAAQILLGPAESIVASLTQWSSGKQERARKAAFIKQIPPAASVVAPLPYLSHLAMREKLYSLHYIIKGLKTLSRSTYDPPAPTDFVLIDYDDSATFDPVAGYYHPAMKTVDGRVIPASELLLHEFLKRTPWTAISVNELTLLRKGEAPSPPPVTVHSAATEIDAHTTLISLAKSSDLLSEEGVEVTTTWVFREGREFIPWMFLKLTEPASPGTALLLSRGLCAPEVASGRHQEKWRITPSPRIPPGQYQAEAVFLDNSKRAWNQKNGVAQGGPPLKSLRIDLGQLMVRPSSN